MEIWGDMWRYGEITHLSAVRSHGSSRRVPPRAYHDFLTRRISGLGTLGSIDGGELLAPSGRILAGTEISPPAESTELVTS